MPTSSAIPELPADMIEVYDPISKRFLFRYSKKHRVVELFHRGVKSQVALDKLDKDAKDPAAVATSRY